MIVRIYRLRWSIVRENSHSGARTARPYTQYTVFSIYGHFPKLVGKKISIHPVIVWTRTAFDSFGSQKSFQK